MFNHNAHPGNQAIALFLLCCELLPFRFFLRLKCLDRCGGIPLEPCILIERYVLGIRRGFVIGDLVLASVLELDDLEKAVAEARKAAAKK